MLKVFNCGTMVTTKLGNLEGMITCYSNRFMKIQYEITYYLNGEFKTVWLTDNEFTTNKSKTKIGFKQ